MGILDMGIVNDGWNRPDDDSTPELSQIEQDEKERREALNEEDDYDDDWRPIETAPKDGTVILMYQRELMRVCWWDNGWTFHQKYGGPRFVWRSPTHWMPLPNPPTDEEDE